MNSLSFLFISLSAFSMMRFQTTAIETATHENMHVQPRQKQNRDTNTGQSFGMICSVQHSY